VPPVAGGPVNAKVAGTTGSTITLQWEGSPKGSYDVLRAGVRIATVQGLTFTDVGLLTGTSYLYSIQGNGVTTPELTATPGVAATATVPAAITGTPTALSLTGSTSDSVSMTWLGPADASYEVLRSGIRIATVRGLAFTDTGLQSKTPYLYSVRGNGSTTATITATIN